MTRAAAPRLAAAAASLRRSPSLPRVLAIVVGLRVLLGVIGWASLRIFHVTEVGGDWLSLRIADSSPLAALVAPWQRWDALWYQHLALSGYIRGTSDAAFFPLYPLLMRGGSRLMGGVDMAFSGLLVSTVAFVVALVLLHRLVRQDLDAVIADRTVLYIAIAPVAFFFLAPYTEALFLCLSVATFLALRRRAWVVAGSLAMLAVLCRSTGIVLLAPFAVAVGREAMQRRRANLFPLRLAHAASLLPVVALGEWFLYTVNVLQVHGGFWGAESAWAHRAVFPWTAIADGVNTVLSGDHPEEILNLAAVLLLLLAIPLMVRRLPWEYVAYTVASVPVVLFREAYASPLASAARYLLVVFPLFVLLATAGRRTWVHRTLVAGLPPLLLVVFVSFVHYRFVG